MRCQAVPAQNPGHCPSRGGQQGSDLPLTCLLPAAGIPGRATPGTGGRRGRPGLTSVPQERGDGEPRTSAPSRSPVVWEKLPSC